MNYRTGLLLYFMMTGSVFCASHKPQEFLDSIRGTAREGEQIVQHFCANCHAVKPVIEMGAPKIMQFEEWQARLKQGLYAIIQHTEEGSGAMPARGGCFECSDQQLLLAIMAMLPEKLKQDLLFRLQDHKKGTK